LKNSVLYRIASVLLLLFAAGGFHQNNPERRADAVLGLMRSIHFDAQGFRRTYWDFFSAFGLFFSVFLLFAALLAWLLGGLPAETLVHVRNIAWALAICFVAVTALSWRYAFTTPIVFSTLITLCLIAAACSAKGGYSMLRVSGDFLGWNQRKQKNKRLVGTRGRFSNFSADARRF